MPIEKILTITEVIRSRILIKEKRKITIKAIEQRWGEPTAIERIEDLGHLHKFVKTDTTGHRSPQRVSSEKMIDLDEEILVSWQQPAFDKTTIN